ncbi:MAG: T9SS type A sorting domain-containing protein [Ignavibacteria bacterium]|nr:T9SS type A sorting domain-containing protein [Ignavibacteria bacterium]
MHKAVGQFGFPSTGTGTSVITLTEQCASCQPATFTFSTVGVITATNVRENVTQAFIQSDAQVKGWRLNYVDEASVRFYCRNDSVPGSRVDFSLVPGTTGIGWGTPVMDLLPMGAVFSTNASGSGNDGTGVIRIGQENGFYTFYTVPGQTPQQLAELMRENIHAWYRYPSIYPSPDSLSWQFEVNPNTPYLLDSTLFIQIDDWGLASSSITTNHMSGASCNDECIIQGPNHIPINYSAVEYYQNTVSGGTWSLINITANAHFSIQNDHFVAVSGGPVGGTTRLHYLIYDSLEYRWKIICSRLIYVDDPLPVELFSLTYTAYSSSVRLEWTTSIESNNSGFEVQRSREDQSWTAIGFVNGAGNSTNPIGYTFEDKQLSSGIYYYRLKQIDFNGNFEYFELPDAVTIGIPDKFSLAQNYPNPFNPVTTIAYGIPVSGNVKLKVFDMSGREIISIVSDFKDAGYYVAKFDASSLASGTYIYRIECGNFVSAMKMLLLK